VEKPNEKCRPTAILRGHLMDDPVAANLRQAEDDDDAAADNMNRLEVLDEAARNILASMYI
jgi:hypothetical protein